MDSDLERKIIGIAQEEIDNDPSHDFIHAKRVLENAKRIAEEEGGDLDIIIPAALFHDLIVYPKDSPKSKKEHKDSAEKARGILKELDDYPNEKIDDVCNAIRKCSFSKDIIPDKLEAKILQDADGLEATGAISVMRTYASTGQMGRKFYCPEEPIPEEREPDPMNYALDLFFTRLLKIKEKTYTETARKIAEERTKFLYDFIEEFKKEIRDSNS